MIPNPAIRVTRSLAQSANAHPLDVLKIKSALDVLGHYEAPEWGVSQFPDAALFAAVEKFQRAQRLKVDGVMKPGGPTEGALQSTLTENQAGTALHTAARALQDMGRNGDEILAHITPEEAQLLHDITDGGSINPQTGLLEFWYGGDYESEAYGVESSSASSISRNRERQDSMDYEAEAYGVTSTSATQTKSEKNSGSGGDNDLNAQSTVVTIAEDDVKKVRRRQAVTTPDDDPALSNGFLSTKIGGAENLQETGMLTKSKPPGTKQAEIERVMAQDQKAANVGEQSDAPQALSTRPARVKVKPQNQYWTPSRPPMPPSKSTPSRKPIEKQNWEMGPLGAAENPAPAADTDPQQDRRELSPLEKKAINGLVSKILRQMAKRGTPFIMTKDQKDFVLGPLI